ncbi:MFS transporter, partial [Thermodesulfobacteriota bacterium]
MEDNRSGFYYGYVIVAAMFVIMVMIWGTVSSFGVFFESFLKEFGWTRALTSGASSTRNLVFGLVCIVTARLTDQFGPRIVITVCGLVLGIGYFGMSRIHAAWQLYLYYGVIISFGMSAYIPMLSIVAKWFERRRGMMTAIVLSGMGTGVMIMPPIANYLISAYTWRTAYVIFAVFGFVLVSCSAQFLKPSPHESNHPISTDKSSGDHKNSSEGSTLSLREAMLTRQFWLLSALYFSFLYLVLTFLIHVVIHATGLGVTAKNAANILAISGALCVVGMNISGQSADRIGNKQTLIISFILMIVSLLILLVARTTWTFYLFAAILGLAYGGMQVLFSPLVAELFGLGSHGVILGSAGFAGSVGAATGPFVTGWIFDSIRSYNPAFILCLIIAVVSTILASQLR